jgi:hypothetical protein
MPYGGRTCRCASPIFFVFGKISVLEINEKVLIWVEKEIAVSWTTGGCFPEGGTIALDLNSIFGIVWLRASLILHQTSVKWAVQPIIDSTNSNSYIPLFAATSSTFTTLL